jgi:Type III restriction enzyme, res subunit
LIIVLTVLVLQRLLLQPLASTLSLLLLLLITTVSTITETVCTTLTAISSTRSSGCCSLDTAGSCDTINSTTCVTKAGASTDTTLVFADTDITTSGGATDSSSCSAAATDAIAVATDDLCSKSSVAAAANSTDVTNFYGSAITGSTSSIFNTIATVAATTISSDSCAIAAAVAAAGSATAVGTAGAGSATAADTAPTDGIVDSDSLNEFALPTDLPDNPPGLTVGQQAVYTMMLQFARSALEHKLDKKQQWFDQYAYIVGSDLFLCVMAALILCAEDFIVIEMTWMRVSQTQVLAYFIAHALHRKVKVWLRSGNHDSMHLLRGDVCSKDPAQAGFFWARLHKVLTKLGLNTELVNSHMKALLCDAGLLLGSPNACSIWRCSSSAVEVSVLLLSKELVLDESAFKLMTAVPPVTEQQLNDAAALKEKPGMPRTAVQRFNAATETATATLGFTLLPTAVTASTTTTTATTTELKQHQIAAIKALVAASSMVLYQHTTASSASAEVIVPPGAGKTLIGVGVYQLHAAMHRTASLCLVLTFSVESTRQSAAEAARLTHCGVHTEVTAVVNAAEAAAHSAAQYCADDDASDSDCLSSTAASIDAAAAAVPAVVEAATTDSSESGHAANTTVAASTVPASVITAAVTEHDTTSSDVRKTTLSVVIISMQRLNAMLKSSERSIRAAALALMQQCDSCVIDESHHAKTARLWRQIAARIADTVAGHSQIDQ